ncbi:MAG TPA: Gfo/Idh/MocA family oxidoreductase [Gemmatimonadales bacterium]|nr:Gfo/Idh/MocA family oxidoreductase [Gemmatimonadales bacterium]
MTVRIGMIGTGFARRVQLPGLKLVPGVKVTGIASGKRANAGLVAKDFGIPNVFADGVELARSGVADLIIVSSTPDTHLRFGLAALEAGRHLLLEKPTALAAPEALTLWETSAARPRQIAWMDHELRYEPNRKKIRELIKSGAIGEVRHIEMALRPYLRGDGRPQAINAPWNWWYDAGKGGGLLGAVGSHLIDQCRFWTGSEVVSVAGVTETFTRRRNDEAGHPHPVTADEFSSWIMRMASGAVATLTLSSVAHHGGGHWCQITGSEGTLVLTGEHQLHVGKPGGQLEDITQTDELWEKTTPNNMWARSFVRLMRDLVPVLGGAQSSGTPATLEDGWKIQRIMDAVRAGVGARLD